MSDIFTTVLIFLTVIYEFSFFDQKFAISGAIVFLNISLFIAI
jgi:hypothetical protein